jgi:KUP system potassium uptake protein
MPQWFKLFGIIIATVAAVIASQALISGSFTLIAEAQRLNLWPKMKIVYPTVEKGQLFIPGVNLDVVCGLLRYCTSFSEIR